VIIAHFKEFKYIHRRYSQEIPMYQDNVIRLSRNPFFTKGVPLPVPQELINEMVEISVMHYDGRTPTSGGNGHIIVHSRVANDVRLFFKTAYELRFPIHSVITVDHFDWDDAVSCANNNSSGFNMRYLSDGRMSKHGIGCAFDINPMQNPCFVLDDRSPTLDLLRVIPENGVYRPGSAGNLQKGHPLVDLMIGLGWSWGGEWTFPKDYQHFQIVPPELAHYVQ
jgi:hypothetical protein